MRLGGPVLADTTDPERWVAELGRLGYRAAYCPVTADASNDVVDAYADSARRVGVEIAEVGAWSNPISPVDEDRRQAVAYNQEQLALADRIGARCCVNVAGSRLAGSMVAPHPDNLTKDTFALIVDTVREIIDGAQPTRAAYTLEAMPFIFPNSADSYLDLIRAIDRDAFAVHFDPVNLVYSPQAYYDTGAIIREFIAKLGGSIKSCHVKDTLMSALVTVHIDEVQPGRGTLDYPTLLRELDGLGDADLPIMLEHLETEQEYADAANHIRGVAAGVGVVV